MFAAAKRQLFYFGPFAVATLARTFVGAALSVLVMSSLEASDSVEIFQLLLLQSALIATTSGAAYPRAIAKSGNGMQSLHFLLAYCALFAALTLVTALAFAITPSDIWRRYVAADNWGQLLLICGAFATGLNSILQGLLYSKLGARRVFLPGAAAQISCIPLMIFFDIENKTGIILLISLTQILPLIALIITNPAIKRGVFLYKGIRLKSVASEAYETFGFGWVNLIYLILFYAFREYWSHSVPASIASYAFFALRLSDIYMQIGYYILSSGSILRRLISRMTDAGPFVRWGAFGIFTAISIASALVSTATAEFEFPSWVWAGLAYVLAQVVCDAPRLVAAGASIGAIRFNGPRRYAAIVVTALLLSAIVFWSIPDADPSLIFRIQITYAWCIVTAWLVLQWRYANL